MVNGKIEYEIIAKIERELSAYYSVSIIDSKHATKKTNNLFELNLRLTVDEKLEQKTFKLKVKNNNQVVKVFEFLTKVKGNTISVKLKAKSNIAIKKSDLLQFLYIALFTLKHS